MLILGGALSNERSQYLFVVTFALQMKPDSLKLFFYSYLCVYADKVEETHDQDHATKQMLNERAITEHIVI